MVQTTQTMPKFREFTYPDGRKFRLSTGVVTEKSGKEDRPKVYVSRWDADNVLRALEAQYGAEEGSMQLPTLYDLFTASSNCEEMKKSVFSFPGEWTPHLILNPNAPTEADDYVLLDAGGKALAPSGTPRLLNPIERHRERNGRKIVLANAFEIPFEPPYRHGDSVRYFEPEDIDAGTGFIRKLSPKRGRYGVSFEEAGILYGTILYWNGWVYCCWPPTESFVYGFRGRSSRNLPPELIESD